MSPAARPCGRFAPLAAAIETADFGPLDPETGPSGHAEAPRTRRTGAGKG